MCDDTLWATMRRMLHAWISMVNVTARERRGCRRPSATERAQMGFKALYALGRKRARRRAGINGRPNHDGSACKAPRAAFNGPSQGSKCRH